ncbi:MAG: hypothetical protein HOV79_22895 [Hamadaea sp.]|nr:hypothetical protein [Hamadaea sp.]
MTAPVADEAAVAQPPPELRTVSAGEKLTPAQAQLGGGRGSLVAIAAPPASGKTTLLVSLYEQFCRGPFAGFTFAGSRTLLGFERMLFHTSYASGRQRPTLAHTEHGDAVLLHLALVAPEPPGAPVDLLMLDASGEVFTTFVDHDELGVAREVLRCADKVVLVVDGARLADPRTRHTCVADARYLLRALTERTLRRSAAVLAVVTKWDLIRRLPEAAAIRADVERALTSVTSRVSVAVVGDLPMFVTREIGGPEPRGLAHLLRWMVTAGARPFTPAAAVPDRPRPADLFQGPARLRRPGRLRHRAGAR